MRKIVLTILLTLGMLNHVPVFGIGQVYYEYWEGIGGGVVADLLGAESYIADLPDGTFTLSALVGPRDWNDNYGARINGYLIPPETANYTFWISSDDQGQFFLSPDDNPDNLPTEPTCTVLTYVTLSPPSWEEYPEQRSASIHLEGGKPYYFRVFVKEGGGSDSLHVGWGQSPNQESIPGAYLSDVHPFGAHTPNPAHRETGVFFDVDLSWAAPPADPNVQDPIYDVFIGSEPNFPGMTQIADGVTETTVGVELDFGIRYYWRVLVYDSSQSDPNDGGPLLVSSGDYWWFETGDAVPIIEQPADQKVFIGETATFTVVADSPTDVTYEWYKTSDPNTSVGSEASLVISNVQVADEGGYYCVLTNEIGSTTTRTAQLIVKRLLGYWPLDGDVTAYDGIGPDGVIYGPGASDPESMFSDGVIGQAIGINLTSRLGEYVVFGSVGITDEMPRTISCWAKNSVPVSEIEDWCTVFGFTSPEALNEQSFDFNKVGSGTQYCIHRYGAEWNMHEIDDEWHFLVATFEDDTVRWYADGELGGSASTNLQTQDLVHLGKRAHSEPLWQGWVDDARIYNYVLDPYEVAELYISVVTDAVLCPEALETDLNEDCRVNILDFAVIAEVWMNCNRFPDCF